ncbi:aldehyde dehydrogenase domain-containing protein [Vararia minispora EC-137]|uniref:Aldehyde dehydrogenase domain-containing protein n=1 Tax=Vararia minispora EC-137 TaxID=1314806 RepID=A0ACB8QLD7_9AGAM|nr:aldehyde dehydrogenase domain-containing protein [Vararia minispora EC-137]
MTTFTHEFNTPLFKKKVSFPTGVFINNEFSPGADNTTIDLVNPSTGRVVAQVSEAVAADVDRAVTAARHAFETAWGLKVPGFERARLLTKLADLMEENIDELAALEAFDSGKVFLMARYGDLVGAIRLIRYYAGWADKNHGQTIETTEMKFAYTRHEPVGVCGSIIPWNFPLGAVALKIGPALATGCTVVLKPSEFTPLSALRMGQLIAAAGFPPGVVNIIVGYGHIAGQEIAAHPDVDKVSFTGSAVVGRKILETSAKTNLKKVTLELGGKSPCIVYDDADLEQAVKWAALGIFGNAGQMCTAGSRIFVQEGIYDKFLEAFTKHATAIKLGDPFLPDSQQGPQISQVQYDRIMAYINSGKEQGAKVHIGGGRHGDAGYWIQPTIFTDVRPDMKIVREEIFGPVGVVIKFKDEDDVVQQANDTLYGLAASIFTKDIKRAVETANRVQAGTVWVNSSQNGEVQTPFGGYKQSGIGRECGEDALAEYTNVKAVHVNLGFSL